jgi:hypothetical protein
MFKINSAVLACWQEEQEISPAATITGSEGDADTGEKATRKEMKTRNRNTERILL